jgi:hypothetical protein
MRQTARRESRTQMLTELADAIRGKTGFFEILRNRMTLWHANEAESAEK